MPRGRRLWTVLRRALRHFYVDRCLDEAATVAFYSLLSLAPLLYIAGVALEAFLPGPERWERTVRSLTFLLPEEASDTLARLVARDVNTGQGLVLLALPALAWVASSGFHALEHAINVAFAREGTGNPLHTRLKAFAALGGSLAFLGLSLLLNPAVLRLGHVAQALLRTSVFDRVDLVVTRVVFLAVTFGAFTLVYKALPRGRSRWSSAGGGALLALPLWEGARQLFEAFLRRSPAFGLLKGTLAGIVGFQVWVYASVAVILFGAEVAAVLNGRGQAGDTRDGSGA